MKTSGVVGSLFLFMVACGGGGAGEEDAGDGDAGDGGDASAACVVDSDCDDGLFCNGAETCSPTDPTADVDGCAPAEDACLAGQTCDESAARCLTDCDTTGDADGDGHDSIDCEGDDCDDADPNRFPGNTEVCDTSKHDEDCDATTFGFRDSDMDGYPDDACCNVDAAGVDVCGTDCQDAMPGIHPTEAESCNGIDDNCDGMIDEGLTPQFFHPDCDGDGFGATGSASVMGCGVPAMTPSCTTPSVAASWAPNDTDCDDLNSSINTSTSEDSCNGIDDNCDGELAIGEDFDRDGFASVMCGGTDCDDGNAATFPGAVEVCDRLDNDCGLAADPGGVELAEDMDGDGHGPAGAACVGGFALDDCDDMDETSFPGGTEVCDGADNDCDGAFDEEPDSIAICSLPHATSYACSAGACAPLSCAAPWRDCNGLASDGCESDTDSSRTNCGTCGMICALSCESARCDEAIKVATGFSHTCALRASGRVVCWGNNSSGQLGDGTTIAHHTPAPTGRGFAAISAGQDFTCGLLRVGSGACWGSNRNGRLGDGTTNDRLVPTTVRTLRSSGQLSAGTGHACALRSSGKVFCWGDNSFGQLGDGTTTDRANPTQVLTGAIAIATGGSSTCAVSTTGMVSCWGLNSQGQLGDGTLVDRSVPTKVGVFPDAVDISVGNGHTCLRLRTGEVMCWGNNFRGQLGDGTTVNRLLPTPVPGVVGAAQVRAGYQHSCARLTSGRVMCWGSNSSGQLGDGTTTNRSSPVTVARLTDATDIDLGGSHSCAVRASGQVMCWGNNSGGLLGDGTTTRRLVPVNVAPMGR
ncbi:MAG: hypothetical protein GXP55_15800 [Deltaproteobacteria bacterium]|nr:hypothetical protein [Deltaproteobacteria bacterium]